MEKHMARILVIDDQEQIRTVIQQILVLDGHDVDMAENGKVGLKLAGLNRYDLVITDVVMPEQDGFGVIMGLKKESPHVRIIVMSGGGARLDIDFVLKTANSFKVDGVFSKPLDFIKLQIAVREVLALEKQ